MAKMGATAAAEADVIAVTEYIGVTALLEENDGRYVAKGASSSRTASRGSSSRSRVVSLIEIDRESGYESYKYTSEFRRSRSFSYFITISKRLLLFLDGNVVEILGRFSIFSISPIFMVVTAAEEPALPDCVVFSDRAAAVCTLEESEPDPAEVDPGGFELLLPLLLKARKGEGGKDTFILDTSCSTAAMSTSVRSDVDNCVNVAEFELFRHDCRRSIIVVNCDGPK